MRDPFVMGNWKLNGSKDMVHKLIMALRNKLKKVMNCNIVIAPPAAYLNLSKHYLGNCRIHLGAQDVDIHRCGAFTGEISADMLKDVGAKYIIIGHSERRILHKETDDMITEKFFLLKESGLIPVLCIGESEEENKAGKTEAVCARQMDAVLNSLGENAFANAIIAYEPIWAIGTGKVATPDQAQSVHKFIRNYMAKHNLIIAEQMIIPYGGSVNTENASKLFTQPDIDGALVGAASLKADAFSGIVQAAVEAKKIKTRI